MSASSFIKNNRKVIDLLACTALTYAPALYYRGAFKYLAISQVVSLTLDIAKHFLGHFGSYMFYLTALNLLDALNPTSIDVYQTLSISCNIKNGLGFDIEESLLFQRLTSGSQLLHSIAFNNVGIGQIAIPKAILMLIAGSYQNSKTTEYDKERLNDPKLSFSKDLPCFYNQVGTAAFFSTISILNNIDMLLLGRTLGSYCTDKYFASTAITIAKLPVAAVLAAYAADALGFSAPRKSLNKISDYIFGKAEKSTDGPAIS